MSKPGHALLNGQLLPASELTLNLPNRGLQFNDGFFETIICRNEQFQWLADHAGRMRWAAAALGLDLPLALSTPTSLAATLTPLLRAADVAGPLRLRVQLWRGGGGLYLPTDNSTQWLATHAPFVTQELPINQAGFAANIRTHFSPVSFCKGPYALHYVLAAQERAARGLDELLLLDAHGHVAEAVAASVFWLKDGQLYTPALESGCVAGVRRAHLLRTAERRGIRCHVGLFGTEAVLAADAVFTANVAGIRAVEQLDQRVYHAAHPLVEALRRWEAT